MKTLTRRSFVKAISTVGIGGAFAATPVSAIMRAVDALHLGDRRFRLDETRSLMGTSVSIAVVHESKDAARQGIERAFAEMERLAFIFDRHQPDSPVSVLNETGRLKDAAPEMYELMAEAMAFYRRSAGAFDPTVLPVVEMIRNSAGEQGRISLTRSDIDDALALVGAESIELGSSEIRFLRKGMAVTMDGIGKGYIVDRASDLLAANGITDHLINAGGDIRARGERFRGQPWIIAIEKNGESGCCHTVIQLRDAALATSDGCEVYFDAEDFRQELCPQTAVTAAGGVSVTVTARSVLEADALSTAAFAMKPGKALNFINEQKGSECLMVACGGDRLFSHSWDSMVRM